MKKIYVSLVALVLTSLICISFFYSNIDNFSSVVTIGVILVLVASYFYFEKSSLGTKEISLIATLSAFAALTRVPFAALPNIKPTTFLVAVSGLVFGPFEGFLVGSTAAFISNIFLGQGPWTPWQMMAWGLVGCISGLIGKRKVRISSLNFSIICFFYGFLFDWFMNLWHVLGFIKPITLGAVALTYISGLTFDIMHACGNFVFCYIFFDKLVKVLYRFKERLEVTYLE